MRPIQRLHAANHIMSSIAISARKRMNKENPKEILYLLSTQIIRSASTVLLVVFASRVWPKEFIGQFFISISVGYFVFLLMDRGYAISAYHVISGCQKEDKLGYACAIARSRAKAMAVSLFLASIIVALFQDQNIIAFNLAIPAVLYGCALTFNFTFLFNVTKKYRRVLLSETAVPLCLMLTPFLTLAGLTPLASFYVSTVLALCVMTLIAALTGILAPSPVNARPDLRVSLARITSYGFTLVSSPVAGALSGSSAAASVALAERTNGLLTLVSWPFLTLLAGATSRLGASRRLLALRSVAIVSAAFAAIWLGYFLVLLAGWQLVSGILFGQGNLVDRDTMALFAVAALLGSLNSFLISGFLMPSGAFGAGLRCTAVGAFAFAISVAILYLSGSDQVVGLSRIVAECAVGVALVREVQMVLKKRSEA